MFYLSYKLKNSNLKKLFRFLSTFFFKKKLEFIKSKQLMDEVKEIE